MDGILNMLPEMIEWIIPFVVAPISIWLMGGFKKMLGVIDTLNPWIQRAIVGGIAVLLTFASATFNVVLPESLALFDPEVTQGLVAAVLAFVAHAVDKKKGDGGA